MRRGSTGQYETTSVTGETIRAFIPNPPPPEQALAFSMEHQRLLERATVALGRLDSVRNGDEITSSIMHPGFRPPLPDPNIFLYAYAFQGLLSFLFHARKSKCYNPIITKR